MKIKLKSEVLGKKREVFNSFDADLFSFLLPPGAILLNFEGSKKGDIVHLKFGFPLYKEWISEIVEVKEGDSYSFFVDIGRKLPLGLRDWNHKHAVRWKSDHKSIIEDTIQFSTGTVLLDILLYPVLFMAFLPRIFQYKTYFKNRFPS